MSDTASTASAYLAYANAADTEALITNSVTIPPVERVNVVFAAYINALGNRKIRQDQPQKYRLYAVPKLDGIKSSKCVNEPDLTFNKLLTEHYGIGISSSKFLTEFYNLDITTVNDLTRDYSEISYNKILNIPASAYLFSIHDCPQTCSIKDDYNYVAYDYHVADMRNYHFTTEDVAMKELIEKWPGMFETVNENGNVIETGKLINEYKNWVHNNYVGYGLDESKLYYNVRCFFDENFKYKYWSETYAFADCFDESEYRIFDIPVTYLDENSIQLESDESINNIEMDGSPYPFTGIICTYKIADDYEIPVFYVDLYKTITAKKKVVNLQFSTNGILSVE